MKLTRIMIPFVVASITFIDLSCVVGTTKIKNLDSNIGSFKVKLNKDDLKEIEDTVPISEVAGNRTTDAFVQCSWKFANTPIKT
jgi:aryl-alcohol dehydrogenase-like predicted oxidoreductase